MNRRTQQMVTLSVLSAIAFLITLITRQISFIPGFSFLTLDMKNVVIVIAGFMYGPFSVFMMSLVVSLIEMLTISADGFFGLLMNVIQTCTFACTAAYIYSRRPTIRSAVIGLVAGVITATMSMLLWNYIITPIYTNAPRAFIAEKLFPVFLPFNLIKAGMNATVAVLLYKPMVVSLRSANLLPEKPTSSGAGKINYALMIAAAFVLLTLILIVVSYLRAG